MFINSNVLLKNILIVKKIKKKNIKVKVTMMIVISTLHLFQMMGVISKKSEL